MVCHDLKLSKIKLYTCLALCVVASGLITSRGRYRQRIVLKVYLNLMTCLYLKTSISVKIKISFKKGNVICNNWFFDSWLQVRINGFRILDKGSQSFSYYQVINTWPQNIKKLYRHINMYFKTVRDQCASNNLDFYVIMVI